MHIHDEESWEKGPENNHTQGKAWLVTADMGYGHQRAIYPLREIGFDKIISVGDEPNTPVIMTPSIGSQEKSNKKWLREIQAGFKQEAPEYADQWLFDLLLKGRLAEAAWAGFLKA